MGLGRSGWSDNGFTLLEVMISAVILGFVILSVTIAFRSTAQTLPQIADQYAAFGIEKAIRNVVFKAAQFTFQQAKASSCAGAAPNFVPQVVSAANLAGIAFGFDAVGSSTLGALPVNSQAYNAFSGPTSRCARISTVSTYMTAGKGVYFCATLNPQAGAQVTADQIWAMQPLIAEFYYTNYDVLRGTELNCTNFVATRDPTMGVLFYTIYWNSARNGNTGLLGNFVGVTARSYSGMVAYGN